jgi:hypothetical protein
MSIKVTCALYVSWHAFLHVYPVWGYLSLLNLFVFYRFLKICGFVDVSFAKLEKFSSTISLNTFSTLYFSSAPSGTWLTKLLEFFLRLWSLKSEPYACYTSALPLEPLCQAKLLFILVIIFFQL